MLNKGKPSREHTYPAIRAALLALLRAWRSPFSLADVPQGCRIQATACDITGARRRGCAVGPPGSSWLAGWPLGLPSSHVSRMLHSTGLHPPLACSHLFLPADWLRTPEADRALAAFNARGEGGGGPRPLAKDAFFAEDLRAEVGAEGWWVLGCWVLGLLQ